MSEFWEKLNTPIPFYTPENVRDTADYINSLDGILYGPIYITALGYVAAELVGKAFKGKQTDKRFLRAAYEEAQEHHAQAVADAAVSGAFIPVVRWLYAMAAIADYERKIKREETAK